MGTAEGAAKARSRKPAPSPAPDTTCKVLLAGVDSLHLSSAAALKPDVVRDLLGRKAESVKAAEEGLSLPRWRTNLTVDGENVAVDLEVQPRGTRKGDLLLTSDAFTLVLHSHPPRNLPCAYVELHAVFLWSGWNRAAALAEALVRELSMAPQVVDVQVSRIDLAVDFMGWPMESAMLEDFTGRALRKRQNFELHHRGKLFTGFTFGGGPLLARIYDKTIEIRSSGKSWFLRKWQEAGYVDEKTSGHVWRLEFQIRREVLRQCELITHDMRTSEGGAGSTEVKSWTDVKTGLNDLWRYLSQHWLSYRLPRTAKQWRVLHPNWERLAQAKLTPLPDGELIRHRQLWTEQSCWGAFAGYAKRSAALDFHLRDTVPTEEGFDAELLRVLNLAKQNYEERHGEKLYDATRRLWQQHVTMAKLFGPQLGRAKPEQMKLH